jgi:hypothetical protein
MFSDRVLQLHNLCAGRIHRRTSFVRVFGIWQVNGDRLIDYR